VYDSLDSWLQCYTSLSAAESFRVYWLPDMSGHGWSLIARKIAPLRSGPLSNMVHGSLGISKSTEWHHDRCSHFWGLTVVTNKLTIGCISLVLWCSLPTNVAMGLCCHLDKQQYIKFTIITLRRSCIFHQECISCGWMLTKGRYILKHDHCFSHRF